jgi:hypothetical protein
LKDKEEVLRIGTYLFNPILSQIHFDFWSDGMNKLMIEERDCRDVTGLGLPDLDHMQQRMRNRETDNRALQFRCRLDGKVELVTCNFVTSQT